jgi:hypothetical protein
MQAGELKSEKFLHLILLREGSLVRSRLQPRRGERRFYRLSQRRPDENRAEDVDREAGLNAKPEGCVRRLKPLLGKSWSRNDAIGERNGLFRIGKVPLGALGVAKVSIHDQVCAPAHSYPDAALLPMFRRPSSGVRATGETRSSPDASKLICGFRATHPYERTWIQQLTRLGDAQISAHAR